MPGTVRLGSRDVAGLVLCGDMYGAPYDLLAAFLSMRPEQTDRDDHQWRPDSLMPGAAHYVRSLVSESSRLIGFPLAIGRSLRFR